jgi:hypothetical protein
MQRRHFKQATSFQDRIDSFAEEAGEQASRLPPGKEQEDMLRKARRADTASHLNEWVSSPGLQPPK